MRRRIALTVADMTKTTVRSSTKPSVKAKSKRNETKSVIRKEGSVSAKVTPFQSRVYDLTKDIPAGQVSTYKAISDVLCSHPRAVGQALRNNPFAPIVPCHRVVSTSLDIGGFDGVSNKSSDILKKKVNLLKSEGVAFSGFQVANDSFVKTQFPGHISKQNSKK